MKRLFAFLMTVFLLASTACANGNSKETISSDKGELSDMKISIQITSDSGKSELTATLVDNSSATAFYQLMKKDMMLLYFLDMMKMAIKIPIMRYQFSTDSLQMEKMVLINMLLNLEK